MVTTLATAFVLSSGVAVPVRVDGPGLLRFLHEGRLVYAKSATLSVHQGRLVGPNGAQVVPSIGLSGDFSIDLEGRVFVEGSERGRLVLAIFPDEAALTTQGNFMYAHNRPNLGNPGEGEHGVIRTGASQPEAHVTIHENGQADPVQAAFDGTTRIELNTLTEIDADRFTIGDIASISATEQDRATIAAIDLGTTPPHGVRRVIDRTRILARVRAALESSDFTLTGPLQATVVRKGHTIKHSQIVEVALAAALQEAGPAAKFDEIGTNGDISVPLGELQLVVESAQVSAATASVRIGIHVDGKRINARTVRFDNVSPTASVRVGQTVDVLVIANGASAKTRGRVRSIDISNGTVAVEIESGATLVGRINSLGQVEVTA